MPGVAHAVYTLLSPQPILLDSVTITFHYCPLAYSLVVTTPDNIPVTLFTKSDNDKYL